MGLPPQIFNVWNGSAWCVSHWLVWHSYILLLIQQCFIERENPQCFSSLRSWGKRRTTTAVHSLSVLGTVTPFLPRVKETFGECPGEAVFPRVLWYLVSSEHTTGCVPWTFGIAVPIVIWLVLSQMDHFEGKLWLSPLYHWNSVSKVWFKLIYDMTKSFSLPKDKFYCK